MAETVRVESRLHGIVLAWPLARAALLSAGGGVLVVAGWPYSVGGAGAVALAAVGGLRAVWAWERTRVLVTDERVVVREGTVRIREEAVALERVGAVGVEESLLGRLLGYGTVTAGTFEVPYVPDARGLVRGL